MIKWTGTFNSKEGTSNEYSALEGFFHRPAEANNFLSGTLMQ